ncbi:molecular chaperone MKKS-like [Uloborus diversus]|uniref:molecular chaperone MKKS-like n=1 Tax=Uloborus diversus TaxID=327109 RepID=UPI002409D8C9|nr:molecular chaperone MKKS-like [Uloborus diversus]
MQSRLFAGLLVKFEASHVILQKLKTTENLKVVLLTFSLSSDFDFPTTSIETDCEVSVWEMTLKYLQSFIEILMRIDINVVACQKVIHPKLRKILEDNNILVLERLGSEVSRNLQLLGVPAISHTVPSAEVKYGIVSVSEEKIGKSFFLLLKNKEKPFSTILICNYNEETVLETKAVCKQIINALFRLLKSQKVCCGAGCTEIFICHIVEMQVKAKLIELSEEMRCSTAQVLHVLKTFLQSVYNLSLSYHQGSLLNFVTEMKFKHLWKIQPNGEFPNGNIKCMCGKYSAESVDQTMWKVFNYTACDSSPNFINEDVGDKKTNSVILDELSCKINALNVAFECASMLLRTSVCISCPV